MRKSKGVTKFMAKKIKKNKITKQKKETVKKIIK